MSKTYYANWECGCDPFGKYRHGWWPSHKGTDPAALFQEACAALEEHRKTCSKWGIGAANLFTADGRIIRSSVCGWGKIELTEYTPEAIEEFNNMHRDRRIPHPI